MTPEGEVTGSGLVDGYDKVRNLYCIVTPNGVVGVPPASVLSLTGAIGKWVRISAAAKGWAQKYERAQHTGGLTGFDRQISGALGAEGRIVKIADGVTITTPGRSSDLPGRFQSLGMLVATIEVEYPPGTAVPGDSHPDVWPRPPSATPEFKSLDRPDSGVRTAVHQVPASCIEELAATEEPAPELAG
eukprot:SAG22_NODE_682_length_7924_cov_25.432460_2_plen_188_part_00